MTQQRIAVIDYGMGNLHSVASALSHVAPTDDVVVTADPDIIASADRVIFPGVGAIRDCMAEILRLDINTVVDTAIQAGKPVLAICVGMQALMNRSEENGGVDCLGRIPGQVKFFSANPAFKLASDESSPSGERLKVPHMGWNQVLQTVDHPMWDKIDNNSRFYFVHSYYVEVENPDVIAGRAHYGLEFTASLFKDNLFAVQFHPEKSHHSGLQLLSNFVRWNGAS